MKSVLGYVIIIFFSISLVPESVLAFTDSVSAEGVCLSGKVNTKDERALYARAVFNTAVLNSMKLRKYAYDDMQEQGYSAEWYAAELGFIYGQQVQWMWDACREYDQEGSSLRSGNMRMWNHIYAYLRSVSKKEARGTIRSATDEQTDVFRRIVLTLGREVVDLSDVTPLINDIMTRPDVQSDVKKEAVRKIKEFEVARTKKNEVHVPGAYVRDDAFGSVDFSISVADKRFFRSLLSGVIAQSEELRASIMRQKAELYSQELEDEINVYCIQLAWDRCVLRDEAYIGYKDYKKTWYVGKTWSLLGSYLSDGKAKALARVLAKGRSSFVETLHRYAGDTELTHTIDVGGFSWIDMVSSIDLMNSVEERAVSYFQSA